MSFEGPDTSDYENVVALNEAYLQLMVRDAALQAGLRSCPESVKERLLGLTATEISRLATTPFLLFSFRERDDRYWTRLLDPAPPRGLFNSCGSADIDTLISAALGFIWQLARQNPYSLRLFCGATLHWCERIAESTFFGLLEAVQRSGDVPELRMAASAGTWRMLLGNGARGEHRMRTAAQLAALQTVLTEPPVTREWMARAARSARPPARRLSG